MHRNRLTWPAEHDRVYDGIGLVASEADVLFSELVDALALERTCLDHVGPFAGDLPGARLIDGFTVDLHPGGYAIEHCDLFAVDRSVWSSRYIENERAVLADGIDEPVNHIARIQIAAVFTRLLIQETQIVPCADAGFRLPGVLHDVSR